MDRSVELRSKVPAEVRRTLILRIGAAIPLVLLFLAAGCASSGTGAEPRLASGDSDLLTSEVMAAAGISNAYDAVQRLRPRWIQSPTGPRRAVGTATIGVAVNGLLYGGPESLREFSVQDIVSLRYLDASQASADVRGLGPGVMLEAAIVVELRGR